MEKRNIVRYSIIAAICAAVLLIVTAFFLGVKVGRGEMKIDSGGKELSDSASVPEVSELSSVEGEEPVERQEENDGVSQFGIPIENYEITEGVVRNGEFFSNLLSRLEVPPEKIQGLTQSAKGIFDLKKIRVGNEYHAFFSKDEGRELDYLIYDIDKREYVRFTLKDTLAVEVIRREMRSVLNYAKVVINTSLWVDVKKSGAPILLALKLADMYAWTIDFFGLQKGDAFEAVYETLYCGDELLSVEKVHYASFVHSGKAYDVYYYQVENESNTYWNEKGESMRKAFLKAPLSFTRISSGFGRRVHPITRKAHQHNGVDYAAPSGTPVMSIGDGTVVFAGRKGAEGNMVKIKHNSVYTTAYLHLSKYGKGIKSGARVSQGQVIGYVGSTGRSTGPHLDFRIWKNGTPVNPLMVSSPPAVPISKELMPDYEKVKSEALTLKNKLLAEETVLAVLGHLKGGEEE